MAEPSVVIGLTGSFGSGCTEISKHLESEGYFRYRLSQPISDLADAKGVAKDDRDALQTLGDDLRKENGPSYLAELAITSVQEAAADKIVLDGIRNTAEIDALRRRFANFYVIAVQAGRDTRWQRVKKKMGLDEKVFDVADARDRGEGEVWGQQVSLCTDMADIVIQNDKDLDLGAPGIAKELWAKVERFTDLMLRPGSQSPQLGELNMSLAANASMRSKCIGRQVGAVITTDEGEVLSVGYNEVPRGDRPCVELYDTCFRKRVRAERKVRCQECSKEFTGAACPSCGATLDPDLLGGKELDLCRALHAEESAILQLAKLGGPSPVGGVVYTTTFPCMLCAKKIVATGVKQVHYIDPYPVQEAKAVLQQAKIEVVPFEGVKAHAFHRLFRRSPGWKDAKAASGE